MAEEKKGRRVFLSFLGTTRYSNCKYIENDGRKSSEVKFIQNSLMELDREKFDKKYIFCTEGAEENFKNLLEESENKYDYEKIKIPDGKNEEEIWKVFEIVYDILEERDKIILDITHSFRYLPMLGITLLQYAKFMKKIEVDRICYGLFELSDFNNGKTEFPIIDITNFSVIQDWSKAGQIFLENGVVLNFSDVAKREFKPKTRNFDKNKNILYNISAPMKQISESIHKNRGLDIIEVSRIDEIRKGIEEIKTDLYPPFLYILEKMEKDLSKFKSKDTYNLIHSVEWCLEKELIQQGITMLQEGLITILLERVGLEYTDRITREEFGNFMGKTEYTEMKEEIEKFDREKMNKIVEELKKQGIDYENLQVYYSALKEHRNDINHGGFNLETKKRNNKKLESEMKSKNFKRKLEENFKKIKEILEEADKKVNTNG